MEKVIKSVQTIGLSGMKKSKINEIKIMGMSLPVYIIAAFVILYAAMTGILPENMVGALAIMMVLGSALNLMGNKIPIVRSYLGGGAVFCIFASSALATFGILPSAVVENCKDFMNNVGFLDFYIAALITGSILGMNRRSFSANLFPFHGMCHFNGWSYGNYNRTRFWTDNPLHCTSNDEWWYGSRSYSIIRDLRRCHGSRQRPNHLPDDTSFRCRKCISNHLCSIDRKNWNDRSSY